MGNLYCNNYKILLIVQFKVPPDTKYLLENFKKKKKKKIRCGKNLEQSFKETQTIDAISKNGCINTK